MNCTEFLDRYYGKVAWMYDATRAYYLPGRDALLKEIAEIVPPGGKIIEVGAGTGRNLIKIRKFLGEKKVTLFAVEPCRPMQDQLRTKAHKANCDIQLIDRFAETWILEDCGGPPDIIFYSYSLSMFPDPKQALETAQAHIKPGGSILIVDFGNMDSIRRSFPKAYSLIQRWLLLFRVDPEKLWKTLKPMLGEARIQSLWWGYTRLVTLEN